MANYRDISNVYMYSGSSSFPILDDKGVPCESAPRPRGRELTPKSTESSDGIIEKDRNKIRVRDVAAVGYLAARIKTGSLTVSDVVMCEKSIDRVMRRTAQIEADRISRFNPNLGKSYEAVSNKALDAFSGLWGCVKASAALKKQGSSEGLSGVSEKADSYLSGIGSRFKEKYPEIGQRMEKFIDNNIDPDDLVGSFNNIRSQLKGITDAFEGKRPDQVSDESVPNVKIGGVSYSEDYASSRRQEVMMESVNESKMAPYARALKQGLILTVGGLSGASQDQIDTDNKMLTEVMREVRREVLARFPGISEGKSVVEMGEDLTRTGTADSKRLKSECDSLGRTAALYSASMKENNRQKGRSSTVEVLKGGVIAGVFGGEAGFAQYMATHDIVGAAKKDIGRIRRNISEGFVSQDQAKDARLTARKEHRQAMADRIDAFMQTSLHDFSAVQRSETQRSATPKPQIDRSNAGIDYSKMFSQEIDTRPSELDGPSFST